MSADDPPVYLFYGAPPALGQNQKDPTHTANFGAKLQERCKESGVPCELVYPGAPDVKHATVGNEIGAQLTEWLDSKRETRALIDRALEMRLQFPLPELGGENWPGMGWVTVADMKIIEGRFCYEREAFDDAAREYLDVVQLGQRMTADGSEHATCVMGVVLQRKGLSAVRRLCSDERVSVAMMNRILARLPVPPTHDRDLAMIFDLEHAFILASLRESLLFRKRSFETRIATMFMNVHATELLAKELYDQSKTNAMCASWAACDQRLFIEYEKLKIRYPDPFFLPKDGWKNKCLFLKDVLLHPNYGGEFLIVWNADIINDTVKRSFHTRTLLNLTRAFVALRILRLETGAYPASLEEVVAKGLLPEVPGDFFDGQPLRYSAEKRLLWSVGEDCADDGGAEKKDVVITLPE